MQINKLYRFCCYANNRKMYSPFFRTTEEAMRYLSIFRYEILEELDNKLETDMRIELLEV